MLAPALPLAASSVPPVGAAAAQDPGFTEKRAGSEPAWGKAPAIKLGGESKQPG